MDLCASISIGQSISLSVYGSVRIYKYWSVSLSVHSCTCICMYACARVSVYVYIIEKIEMEKCSRWCLLSVCVLNIPLRETFGNVVSNIVTFI